MQSYNKWNNKSLVLELSSTNKTLPGDVSLTVTTGDKNQQYWPDSNGNFVIPLTWATSQDVNLTLNSDVAEAKGKAYQFQAKLYAGAKDGQVLIAAGETDTGVTAESLSLTVAENTNPSLKITDTTGTHRLLTTVPWILMYSGRTLTEAIRLVPTSRKKHPRDMRAFCCRPQ